MEDVIIIGGGPVGFISALGLAQAGVRVTVIEAEPQIIDSPRAAVYFWSVLAGLGRLGILEDAEAAGVLKQEYTYVVPRTGERIAYSMDVLKQRTPHPYNLHLGQHRLADIAMRRMKTFSNATVRFGARLQRLDQDAGGVTLTVATQRETEELRARWVIGADGAGSTVRRLLGLSFDGITWAERFVATNVHYDFEHHGYGRATFVIDDRFGAVIVILNDEGLWRCTYMEDATLPEETLLERLPGAFESILPGRGSYDLERASPYRMHQRSAQRYRVGRVILAGDAAHATNPTGGLGLTSGLFDCYALYPALAAVVLEGADDEVLDRYSAARRDIFINRVSPQATANKQLIFHANGGGESLELALAGLRRVAADPEFRCQRLMFTKSLETSRLLRDPRPGIAD
jgi:3-(3-hydroxy-phenyl)propionate hydroxylase/6-hydroxy-3-succinoylpyridine 3-monooxygenase